MTTAATTTPTDALARSPLLVPRAAVHILFALLLVIGTLTSTDESMAATTFGAVLLALWYGLGVWRDSAPRGRSAYLWLAVLLLGWFALQALTVNYSWVAFALFFVILDVLPIRAAVPVVALTTAAVIGTQLSRGAGTPVAQVIGPVLGAGVSIGIVLGYRRIATESERRRRLLAQLVAAQDDLVATHDQLASAQRSAGALAERARLARDIHDTLAQGFSSILLLARVGLADPSRAIAELRQIEATAGENLEEARRVVHALTPVELEEGALPAALRRLTDRLTEQTGVRSEVKVDGRPLDVPTTIDVGLLRLAQGGLANVRQHAHARRVAVTLTYGPRTVSLDVVDDGCGFDPAQATAVRVGGSGFGLRAMQERVTALGGELVIESAPGEGTAVSACIPTDDGRPRW